MPAEEQDRISGPSTASGDADTTVAGYGLGLYFADRLVPGAARRVGVESPIRPGRAAWLRASGCGYRSRAAGPEEDDDAPWLDAPPAPHADERSADAADGADLSGR